jgi:hypothetical protein
MVAVAAVGASAVQRLYYDLLRGNVLRALAMQRKRGFTM